MFRNLQGSTSEYLSCIEEKPLRIKSANCLMVDKGDHKKVYTL